jgi:hypothetical protein
MSVKSDRKRERKFLPAYIRRISKRSKRNQKFYYNDFRNFNACIFITNKRSAQLTLQVPIQINHVLNHSLSLRYFLPSFLLEGQRSVPNETCHVWRRRYLNLFQIFHQNHPINLIITNQHSGKLYFPNPPRYRQYHVRRRYVVTS